jgi:hypothetical protein
LEAKLGIWNFKRFTLFGAHTTLSLNLHIHVLKLRKHERKKRRKKSNKNQFIVCVSLEARKMKQTSPNKYALKDARKMAPKDVPKDLTKDLPEVSYTLGSFTELRFKARNEKIIVVLVQGQCEYMGANMTKNKQYQLYQGAVLCFFGPATLLVIGHTDSCYVSNDVMPFVSQCVSASFAINCKRNIACEKAVKGPSVFVCGEGRASFCKILANWSLRLGATNLVFGDLDFKHNIVAQLPACIGATGLTETLDIEETKPKSKKLVYCFGKQSNVLFYEQQCQILVKKIQERTSTAGNIIKGSDNVAINAKLIQWIHPDIVIVLGNEDMFQKVHQDSTIPHDIAVFHFVASTGLKHGSAKEMKTRQMHILESQVDRCVPQLLPYTSQIMEMEEQTTPVSVLPLDQQSRLPRLGFVEYWNWQQPIFACVYKHFSHLGTNSICGIAKLVPSPETQMWTAYSTFPNPQVFQVIHM